MAKLVVCKILVTLIVNTGTEDRIMNVAGRVISSNEQNYLVDFSLNAVQWRGDYSQVIVRKNECVELK